MRRGADILVDILENCGVKRIFSLSGNQIMPIYDACVDRNIEIIHVRHEAAAVYMAEAEAQLTGNIAVALVTAGPGFANAIGPLLSAIGSESPVLLISGDSPVAEDGKGAFQEMEQTALSGPVTKMAIRCDKAEDLENKVHELIQCATTGRPGPVHLALPVDVATTRIGRAASIGLASSHDPNVDETLVSWMADHIDKAERPLFVLGPQGNRPPHKDVIEGFNLAGIPTVCMESPRGLNDPSLGQFKHMLDESDLVISLGKKIDFQLGFGTGNENRSWIVIDWEQSVLDQAKRNLGSALVGDVLYDPHAVGRTLLQRIGTSKGQFSDWMYEFQAAIAEHPLGSYEENRTGILPQQICAAVQNELSKQPSSILIADGGEFGQWVQAGISANRRVINGTTGAIGGGLCYALGAALSEPEATVFCLMGDGTAGFHFMEFETAVRHNLPIIVVIGNDQKWNAEYQIQVNAYGSKRVLATKLSGARYDLAAAALGVHGEFVEQIDALEGALRRSVASGKPACINIKMQGLPAPNFD